MRNHNLEPIMEESNPLYSLFKVIKENDRFSTYAKKFVPNRFNVMIYDSSDKLIYKYNYNCISYLTEIYWIGNQPPGVGLRPPMVVPYGIPNGADTIHPALFQTLLGDTPRSR